MKKNHDLGLFPRKWLKKILFIMRLTVFFCLVCMCNLSANVHAQNIRFDLKMENATIEQVLNRISESTKLDFFYNNSRIDVYKKINVDLNNVSVEEALRAIFKGREVKFDVTDKFVVIHRVSETGDRNMPQQARVIRGVVKDTKGSVLPGVTIVLKGTHTGGVTDFEGKFNLELPQMENLILLFSFVGMETAEVEIRDDKPLVVVMKEDVQAIDEVVVTGYFNKAKTSYTGSAVSVKGEDLKKISPTNLFKALQAYEPSFQIVENKEAGADPNHVPDILIRGKSSFEGKSNNPLFIMDGYEVSLQTIFDTDMERISQVTILKDAAATAIYGSRAANGVIVIETKMPAQGKLSVSYSFNGTVEYPDLTDYDLLNAGEKLEFERLAGVYKNEDLKKQMDLDRLYEERKREVLRGVNTYWLSKPLQTAFKHTHSLFLGGGNERSRYGVNINYGANPGIMKESKRDRLGLSFTWTYSISNKIRIGNMLSVNQTKSSESPYGNFSSYARINPYERATDDKGRYVYKFSNGDVNPLFNASLNSFSESENTSYTDNFDIEWYVFDGLRVTGRFSYTFGNSGTESFISPKDSQFEGKPDDEKGIYRVGSSKTSAIDGNIVVNFYKQLDKHMFTVVGGLNMQSNKSDSKNFAGQGFLSDNLSNMDFAAQYEKNTRPSGKVEQDRLIGFFANASYGYDNRYMFDISYRTDGSSKFGEENRFAPFWAAGLAWNIHNEHFLEGAGWLDMLKLRASIGNPGNQNFDAYIAMKIYTYNNHHTNPWGVSAIINNFGNPDLEWQKTLDRNIGLDLVVFNNRLRMNFDYFSKKTDPLLVYTGVPSSTGGTSVPANVGGQVTKGYTVVLNYALLKKEHLLWQVNATLRHLTSEYRNVSAYLSRFNDENKTKNMLRYYDGGSPSDLWAVRSAGIDAATGREIFLHKDGTQSFAYNVEDEVVVGNSDPKLEGVVGMSFYYKGFSASANFRYRLGGQIFMETLYNKVENISFSDVHYNQDKRALYDRWKEPGDNAKFRAISTTADTPMSSRFVADNNVFSGESISVGYESQGKWLKSVGASSLTVRAYMNDIFRISTVKNERGIDYPFARSVSMSLGLRF